MSEAVNNAIERERADQVRTSPRLVDASFSFWPLVCAKCNVIHLVPADLLAAWISLQSPVFCPNGHATVYPRDAEPLLVEQLSASLVATRMELSRLRIIRGRSVAKDLDPAKAQRLRARELAASAESIQTMRKRDGRRCPICSAVSQNEPALVRHILRNHKEQLGGPIAAT